MKIWILGKKEMKSYFFSPMVYLLAALYLFILGWFFFNNLVLSKNQTSFAVNEMILPNLLGNMNFLFLVVTPLISMRTFAEEKKQQTLSLLLTSSLSHWEIILGKLFASFTIMAFMISLTLVFPAILLQAGDLDVALVFSGYLGTLLNVLCFLAIGQFFSSLTENQILAALMTFVFLFALLLLSHSPFVVSNQILGQILSYLSLPAHFEAFNRGVLRSMDIVYYLSFIGFSCYLTHQSLESRHW